MQCKQCHAEISIAVAGETTRNIKRFCEVVGMAPEAASSLASQRGPLCRKCMQNWGAGEDDVQSTPQNTAQPR